VAACRRPARPAGVRCCWLGPARALQWAAGGDAASPAGRRVCWRCWRPRSP
jgi:hypothetical protein